MPGAPVSGRSGLRRLRSEDPIAAEVPDFDPEEYIERKEARRLDRYDQLFLAATHQALEDAGISYEADDPAALRAGVVVGPGSEA